MILDMVADHVPVSVTGDQTQATDVLREFEVMDRRLDDAAEILLADATSSRRGNGRHVQPNQPPLLPTGNAFWR